MELTDIQREIERSLTSGFVDRNQLGTQSMMPQFIHNAPGDKMMDHLREELGHCSSFTFAIAFITESALTPLKVKLADLATHGVRGRILTSNYLNFNAPKVFRELEKLDNVEVRIAKEANFHAKGYIFDHEVDHYQSAIIGSSNLTGNALSVNYEWNIKFTSYDNGAITAKLIDEVEEAWQQAEPLNEKWIADYEIEYQKANQQRFNRGTTVPKQSALTKIKPNAMQSEALANLAQVRASGEHRALVISATGTGKTYMGALDVANYEPRKFLYIVHREQILDKTMYSFKRVLSNEKDTKFGKISGNQKDLNAKYLFATIQTLAKDEWLHQLNPAEFDYILVDEAHRAGAVSYQKVLNYFKPKFLLGMTATPERMDDFNLYEMFDYQIAYEIRLQKALDEEMLCPFHYIGITDYERDGETSDETSDMQWLVAKERVDYIEKQTDYYGYSGDALQGLIFCSRKSEAEKLAVELTKRGHPSKSLTGETPQHERDAIVAELENKQLEYIITVDVFNEGIDIPCVNQVVMLRNTQSSIVFIQQLGRGLRKAPNKDFVTVIDFIGNYKNNYLIPIALTGDKSRDKDNAREDIERNELSGLSTINFSEIAKERIYQSIQKASLDDMDVLRKDYRELKNRLGRRPLLVDFQEYGTVDCMVFANKCANYYRFLVRRKEDVYLTNDEEAILSFVSIELMNGKRVVELRLLDELINTNSDISVTDFKDEMQQEEIYFPDKTADAMLDVLSLNFFKTVNQKKYGNRPVITLADGVYRLNPVIRDWLKANENFNVLMRDALKAGLIRADQYQQTEQFTLYKQYTRKDVCRLLGWSENLVSTVYGYYLKDGVCPIFVNYEKSDNITASLNYQDRFINQDTFQWYTKSGTKLHSETMDKILNKNNTFELFIRKEKDVDKDKSKDKKAKRLYYFGQVSILDTKQEQIRLKNGKTKSVVRVILRLKATAPYDQYLLFEK